MNFSNDKAIYVQIAERDRCHLHPLLLYLRSAVGFVCLQSAHQASGKRPLVAMGLHRQSAHLLRHRYPYLAVCGL